MTKPITSYTIDNITIRDALPEEWPQIFCIHEIANEQKRDNGTASSLDKHYLNYKDFGEELIIDSWRKPDARFLIATVPPENVSVTIPDYNGQAIVGVCGIRWDENPDEKMLWIDKLYSIRSSHAVGSALMGHSIRAAKENDAECIMLNAPYEQSHKWYQEKALFKTLEGQGSIISSHYNMMDLYRENFDKSLEKLQQPAIIPSSKPLII